MTSHLPQETSKSSENPQPEPTAIPNGSKHLAEMLEEEIASYPPQLSLENASPQEKDARLKKVIESIHSLEPARSALCLSGGGIRSASFALGVLQALAQKGLLGKFDYLSTVSGGGFIGGWLSAWIRNHKQGKEAVLALLREGPHDPTDPEWKPIRSLGHKGTVFDSLPKFFDEVRLHYLPKVERIPAGEQEGLISGPN